VSLRDPTPEEREKARELARRFGGDEAETERLADLGRRAEALLLSPPPEELPGLGRVWLFLRQRLLEPGSLATGGINPAEEVEGDDCEDIGSPAKSPAPTRGLMFLPGYRLAACLDRLRRQVNTLAPKRSKKSDGWIGDAAHASRASDHNPWVKGSDGVGVVTAIDITHDLAGGMDCSALAGALSTRRDPRIKYIIWNGRICSSEVEPWTWRKYTGKNQHTHHLHISVKPEPELYDKVEPWAL
jgi:hypothetical protein